MSVLLSAANSAEYERLSQAEIKKRNAALDRQLAAQGLRAVNVAVDGNCYFRALSINLYDNKDAHLQLRHSIIQNIIHLASEGKSLPGVLMDLSNESTRHYLEQLKIAGTWVGEDMITASAAFLHRTINVFSYSTSSCPQALIYKSDSSVSALPIMLAYYSQGHYKAVEYTNRSARVPGNGKFVLRYLTFLNVTQQ